MESISIFENLDSKEIDKLLKCFEARERSFNKDAIIMTSLGNNSTVGIITKGKAELIRNDYYGNRTILETLGKGDIFGDVFSNYNIDELSITAAEETDIVFIDYYHLTKSCPKEDHNHSKVFENTMKILSDKVVASNERVEILAKRTIRDKLLAYFELLSKKNISKKFELPFTYTDLADYLGVDRSAMQRELKNLKEDEFIKTKGKQITLLY